jgi:transketolase
VHIALEAASRLEQNGIAVRVVGMPSWELFERQTDEYRKRVLPPHVKARIAIEAASTFGWDRYVGSEGEIVGIDRFGASAPYKTLYEKFGITPERVVERTVAILKRG